MIVKAWNNGSPNDVTGAGYGIRLSKDDRDKFFSNSWKKIILELENDHTVNVNLSDSFWEDCIELRSSKIGKWMLKNKLAPWETSNPPALTLEAVEDKNFRLSSSPDYSNEYTETAFWDKIAKFAKKAGKEVILKALTLYYCAMHKDTPKRSKAIILGALGYFILLTDLIPDITPIVGLSDDLGALALAFAIVAAHVKPEHRRKAEETLKTWFG